VYFAFGGLVRPTPFNIRVINGCVPIEYPSIWGNIIEIADLAVLSVL